MNATSATDANVLTNLKRKSLPMSAFVYWTSVRQFSYSVRARATWEKTALRIWTCAMFSNSATCGDVSVPANSKRSSPSAVSRKTLMATMTMTTRHSSAPTTTQDTNWRRRRSADRKSRATWPKTGSVIGAPRNDGRVRGFALAQAKLPHSLARRACFRRKSAARGAQG